MVNGGGGLGLLVGWIRRTPFDLPISAPTPSEHVDRSVVCACRT